MSDSQHTKRSVAVILVLLLAVLSFAANAGAQIYEIVDLGTLGGAESSARSINEKGSVVGWSYTNGTTGKSGFLWRPSVGMTNLGSLGGVTDAQSVNNADHVVGSSGGAAFLWQNGVMTNLGIAGNAVATCINDSGQIVGAFNPSDPRAFLWQNGTSTTLSGLGGVTVATAINERGNIAGFSNFGGGDRRVIIWRGGTSRSDTGRQGESAGMNNLDWITGRASSGQAFLWNTSNFILFGPGEGKDVSDHGWVVGELQFPGLAGLRAFLWKDDNTNGVAETGEVRDLNDLIPPASGWFLSAAQGINNFGAIVGEGIYEGKKRAFLMRQPLAPAILLQPTNRLVLPDTEVTFSVGFYGDPLPSFQWYFNGTNMLAGQTNASLVLSNVQFAQAGNYAVTVSNAFGTTISSNATLVVFDIATASPDSDIDGDSLSDYAEVFIHGTNPLKPDSDGDSIPDSWEIQYGLNPRVNDANDDRDLDGLTSLQEYQNRAAGYRPDRVDSLGDGRNDFERLFGTRTNRMYYDRTDRLVGLESSRGVSFAYQYDGNGNLVRQTVLSRITETNGLPVLWSFLNGLTSDRPSHGLFGDADGDGWSNYQEWKASTSPTNQVDVPKAGSAPQTPPIAQVLPADGVVGALALVLVRLWDAEGSPSLPELQFQTDGSTNWTDAVILFVDSAPWSTNSFVIAPPTGMNHVLCWNAATNFPPGTSNSVWLRARATDITTNGGWSQPVAYRVEIPIGPHEPPRFVQPVVQPDGSFHATLEGQVGGRYIIQASTNLVDWGSVTNVTHSSPTILFRDPAATNLNRRFYRVVSP